MEPIIEGWTIVIVGKWNANIFSPEWTSKNLFKKEEGESIKMELQIGPDFNFRLIDGNIQIYPATDKLTIAVTRADDETLDYATAIAHSVLSILSHTPVRAVGINFHYKLEDPAEKIKELLALKDRSFLAAEGYAIESTVVKRTLKKDENVLNFSVVHAGNYMLEFNFHRDVNNCTEAQEAIGGGFRDKVSCVREIAGQVYGIDYLED